MHPALTHMILKTVSEVSTLQSEIEYFSTEWSETTRETTPSNLFSGFSTPLWKSSNRGAYLVLVLLQQQLEGSVAEFILHVLSMLCPMTELCGACLCPCLPWLEPVPGGTICFQSVVCTMWLQQYFVSCLAVALAPGEVAMVRRARCSSVSLALAGSGGSSWSLGRGAVQLFVN